MNNLDTVRAVAVLAVFCSHLRHVYGIDIPFFGTHGGWFGVQLFFLLSGYLILQSAAKYPLWTYIRHRVLRIFPAYLAIYVGLGMVSGMFTREKVLANPWGVPLNLVLMQHLSPKALHGFDSTHLSWTLTVEVFWYMLAPLLVLPFRRAPNIVLAIGIVVSSTWTLLAAGGLLDGLLSTRGVPLSGAVRYLFLNNAFPAQLVFFLLGAYIACRREMLTRINPVVAGVAFVAITATWSRLIKIVPNPLFISGIALSGLFILALRAPTWNCRPVKWIADISYSIYLLHFAVLVGTYQVLHWRGLPGGAGAFLLTLLASIASYLIVERPAMRLARRK